VGITRIFRFLRMGFISPPKEGHTERRTMKVVVTKSDIKNGKGGLIHGCPIALSLKRRYKYVSVLSSAVVVRKTLFADAQGFHLPAVAVDFIKCFDAGLAVKPFKFNL
jgi:hypothetical protein